MCPSTQALSTVLVLRELTFQKKIFFYRMVKWWWGKAKKSMPQGHSTVKACLSESWQVHGQFTADHLKGNRGLWWFYWECGILKTLFSLNLMSQRALASTAEKYKWLILPVGVHFVSFTSPYLVIFIQHTVKFISEWRGHANGSKVFKGIATNMSTVEFTWPTGPNSH